MLISQHTINRIIDFIHTLLFVSWFSSSAYIVASYFTNINVFSSGYIALSSLIALFLIFLIYNLILNKCLDKYEEDMQRVYSNFLKTKQLDPSYFYLATVHHTSILYLCVHHRNLEGLKNLKDLGVDLTFYFKLYKNASFLYDRGNPALDYFKELRQAHQMKNKLNKTISVVGHSSIKKLNKI